MVLEQIKPTSQTSKRRVINNSLYSAGSYVLVLPVNLLLYSFVVHRIGIAAFGIWATLTTILGLGSLLDLGVTTPLVKYVAEYMALGRRREINVLLSTAAVFYLVVSVVFLTAMTFASHWILLHVFHAGAHDDGIRRLYFAVMLGFAASLTFSVLQSLIIGLQRTDIIARLGLLFSLLGALLTVVALNLGLGVNGLAISWAAITILAIARNWIVAKRLFPELLLNPFLFNWANMKTILSFSTRVQVTSLTLVLNDQVDRTLIAYVLGPAMLGFYAVASRAASALRSISFGLMAGILPAASDLSAVNDTDKLRHLYLRASRYIVIADFGLCIGVATLATPLVHLWLGSGYGRSALTLTIVLVGYAMWLPDQATTEVLNGVGRPDVRMRADLIFLFIHAPLSVVLLWRFGYFGTVVGTSVALTLTRLYLYVTGARVLEVGVRALLRFSFLQPAIAAALAVGAASVVPLAGAPLTLPSLLLEGFLFTATYLGYVGLFALDRYDRQLAASMVGRLQRKPI